MAPRDRDRRPDERGRAGPGRPTRRTWLNGHDSRDRDGRRDERDARNRDRNGQRDDKRMSDLMGGSKRAFPRLPESEPELHETGCACRRLLPRKEVIQPQVPLQLPCYDLAPVTELTLDGSLPKVRPPALGTPSFHRLTGGVYKARERIHRSMADLRLLAIPASWSRVADSNPNLDRLFGIRSTSRYRSSLCRPL